jgi:hypothetical protein
MWRSPGRVAVGFDGDEFWISMREFDRLIEWIDLSFVERIRTPEWAMQVRIRYHLAVYNREMEVLRDCGASRNVVAEAMLKTSHQYSHSLIAAAISDTSFQRKAVIRGESQKTSSRPHFSAFQLRRRISRNSGQEASKYRLNHNRRSSQGSNPKDRPLNTLLEGSRQSLTARSSRRLQRGRAR